MKVTLNGEAAELADALTVEQLLRDHGYGERKVAVAINQCFVPRGQHAQTTLNEGDEIEIVAPMPGG